jgi:hypothetical protein
LLNKGRLDKFQNLFFFIWGRKKKMNKKCLNCYKDVWPGHYYCCKTCSQLTKVKKCLNCKLPANKGFNYCSKSCSIGITSNLSSSTQNFTTIKCLVCNKSSTKGFNYCSKDCSNKNEPSLIELDVNDKKYKSVEKQFQLKWKKNNVKILKIRLFNFFYLKKKIQDEIITPNVMLKYLKYKNDIILKRKNLKIHGNGGKGNEHRRFHGTAQLCDLGLNKNTKPCKKKGCVVCSIILYGWQTKYANKKGMFGAGLYFTATPLIFLIKLKF